MVTLTSHTESQSSSVLRVVHRTFIPEKTTPHLGEETSHKEAKKSLSTQGRACSLMFINMDDGCLLSHVTSQMSMFFHETAREDNFPQVWRSSFSEAPMTCKTLIKKFIMFQPFVIGKLSMGFAMNEK